MPFGLFYAPFAYWMSFFICFGNFHFLLAIRSSFFFVLFPWLQNKLCLNLSWTQFCTIFKTVGCFGCFFQLCPGRSLYFISLQQGPDYRLYKSEPELTTVTEVDENNGEERAEHPPETSGNKGAFMRNIRAAQTLMSADASR